MEVTRHNALGSSDNVSHSQTVSGTMEDAQRSENIVGEEEAPPEEQHADEDQAGEKRGEESDGEDTVGYSTQSDISDSPPPKKRKKKQVFHCAIVDTGFLKFLFQHDTNGLQRRQMTSTCTLRSTYRCPKAVISQV